MSNQNGLKQIKKKEVISAADKRTFLKVMMSFDTAEFVRDLLKTYPEDLLTRSQNSARNKIVESIEDGLEEDDSEL